MREGEEEKREEYNVLGGKEERKVRDRQRKVRI